MVVELEWRRRMTKSVILAPDIETKASTKRAARDDYTIY